MTDEIPKVEPIEEAPKPHIVQLDQVTLMRFELMSVKKKLNMARRQNLELSLLDLRREERQLEAEEGKILEEVFKKLGVVGDRNLRLVDPAKGLCVIEDATKSG